MKLGEVVEHEGKKFWIFSLLEIAKYIIGLCSFETTCSYCQYISAVGPQTKRVMLWNFTTDFELILLFELQ